MKFLSQMTKSFLAQVPEHLEHVHLGRLLQGFKEHMNLPTQSNGDSVVVNGLASGMRNVSLQELARR
jgi:hypothetical protein